MVSGHCFDGDGSSGWGIHGCGEKGGWLRKWSEMVVVPVVMETSSGLRFDWGMVTEGVASVELMVPVWEL
ncbi:hypothetical protein V6N11_059281 [Hibiscus sabdariffa]|uniref:Uncharacterized protein n=1 Tax=Hibiscus sabdariffa TaxID=183260 RepID=A0ABR2U6T0_9ROSI